MSSDKKEGMHFTNRESKLCVKSQNSICRKWWMERNGILWKLVHGVQHSRMLMYYLGLPLTRNGKPWMNTFPCKSVKLPAKYFQMVIEVLLIFVQSGHSFDPEYKIFRFSHRYMMIQTNCSLYEWAICIFSSHESFTWPSLCVLLNWSELNFASFNQIECPI
jgi:hypothetical protein